MRIGFVSTRFGGLDGVTLETEKLALILRRAGHEIFWFAGELGAGIEPGLEFPRAHFDTPENRDLERLCFGRVEAPPEVREQIADRAADIESALGRFVEEYAIELLFPQNCLAIPMQIPLGVGLTDFLASTGMAAVAHHHDFAWERKRFSPTAVPDILHRCFPPNLPEVRHLVINTPARAELAARRSLPSTVLPNIMDFAHPPDPGDAGLFRRHLEVGPTRLVLLQPTRIIPRKGIEHTIELAARLASRHPCVAITHPELDEGGRYLEDLRRLAESRQVDLRLAPVGEPGTPALADAYAAADLVCYPSRIEGFGNALLEAMYFRRPLMVNRYPVYTADIAPTGVRAVEIDGEVTSGTLAAVTDLLDDPGLVEEIVEHNYAVGRRHFSFEVAEEILLPLLGS